MRIFESAFLRGRSTRFRPYQSLQDKENFSRHIFIEIDGTVDEVVRLNVLDDRHREELVAFHFWQHYENAFMDGQHEPLKLTTVGRDCPWDFEYILQDGTQLFLEICRIADKELLKAIKSENDVTSLLKKDKLKGYEILKIERHFPGTLPIETVSRINSKEAKQKSYNLDQKFSTPKFFLRPPMMPSVDIIEEMRTAVSKKMSKRNEGKERTILVLDNLTTHANPDDFFDAAEALKHFFFESPFQSIWLYTGYYSGDDGYNCEYSIIPLKLTSLDDEILSRLGKQSK